MLHAGICHFFSCTASNHLKSLLDDEIIKELHLCCHFSLKIANKKSLGNVRNLSENKKNINAFFQVQGLTMVSWVKP
jgi:hypothetical protein